jgi:hypothetical protein
MTNATTLSRFLRCSIVATIFSTAACGKADDSATSAAANTPATAAQAAQGEEDLADIGEYRLTMDKFDKWLAAQRNVMMKAKNMTDAEKAAFAQQNEGNNNASIDDMARAVSSNPMMNQAVRDAGLSPREYALVMMSFVQTGMAAAVAGMRPNDNQDSLIRAMKANPENVKFYKANEAEITRKSKALEEEMKRLGVDDM